MMEVGQCRLKISREGSDIPLLAVTPAEVMILIAGHEVSVNGKPIKEVSVIGTRKEEGDLSELTRLKNKYGNLKANNLIVVNSLFPGANPRLPQKFSEIPDFIVKKEPRVKVVPYVPIPGDVVTVQTSEVFATDILPLEEAADEIVPLPEATDVPRPTNEESPLNEAQDSPILSVNRRKR